MGLLEQQAAERCIEIIKGRQPITPAEILLLRVIVNDIRLGFELKGAVSPLKLTGGGDGPKEWFW